jgi:Flp pilus assembly protein TadD
MMRSFLVVLLCAAGVGHAQREFVEEVQGVDDIDLDAPDPAKQAPPPAPPPPPPPEPAPTPGKRPPVKPPPTTSPLPIPTPTTPTPEGALFQVQPTDRAAFLEKTTPFFSAVLRGDPGRAQKSLSGLQQGAYEAAIQGLHGSFAAPSTARALSREGMKRLDDGNPDDAGELADVAERLAPDDASTRIAVAQIRLSQKGPVAGLGELPHIMRATLSDPVDRGSLLARLAALGVIAILVLMLIVTFAGALPALAVVGFDILSRLPRGAHPAQGVALMAVLALGPIALGAGVVPWLACLAVLGVAAMPRRLRSVTVFTLALSVAIAPLTTVFATGVMAPSSSQTRLHRALFDVDGHDDVAALRAADDAGLLEQIAIANADRREGRIDDAMQRYRGLVQHHGHEWFVHGGYGVVLANAGETDLALAEFGLAIERARSAGAEGQAAAAAFDASMSHHAAGRPEKAQAMLGPLAEPGSETLSLMRQATFRAVDEVVLHNRALVEVLPPRSLLRPSPSPASDALLTSIQGVLFGAAAPFIVMLLGALAALSALLAAASGRLGMAHPCERCGAPASARVDGPGVPAGTCAACFHAFLSPTSRVEGGTRLRKENAIRRRAHRRARLVILLSILPGAGHIFAGAAARGAALAVVGATAIAGVVVFGPLWPSIRVNDITSWMGAVPALLMLAVAMAVSVRSALLVADDERRGLS